MATVEPRSAAASLTQDVLHLIAVGEDFDPAHDLVLGPWCLASSGQIDAWERTPVVDPFTDHDEVKRAGAQVALLADHLVAVRARALDARHRTPYGYAFWRVLILPWVMELAGAAWSRWRQVERFIERHGDRRLTADVWGEERKWRFATTTPFFVANMGDPRFHFWLDSMVVAALAPAHWHLHKIPVAIEPSASRTPAPTSTIRRIKHRIGFSDIASVGWAAPLLAIAAQLGRRQRDASHDTPPKDWQPEASFPSAFLELLDRLLDLTEPECFGPGFAALVSEGKQIRYRPGRLRVGTIDWTNDAERAIAAFARLNGERLVQPQHGGFYGLARHYPQPAAIEYSSDVFVTWGWTAQEDYRGRFVPLPSPWLRAHARAHRGGAPDLIFVGTRVLQRFHRLAAMPLPSQATTYYRDKVTFLDALTPEIRHAVLYRPYPRGNTDVDDDAYMARRCPDVRRIGGLSEGAFHDAIRRCRLLVLDHNLTTLNIAMAANIPTVCFWRREAWPSARQAEPYMEALRRAGVLFDAEPKEAAAHVNRIWSDVDAWWRSGEVQQARAAWAERYALTSRFWLWHWLKALPTL